jgi:hypothetical protein
VPVGSGENALKIFITLISGFPKPRSLHSDSSHPHTSLDQALSTAVIITFSVDIKSCWRAELCQAEMSTLPKHLFKNLCRHIIGALHRTVAASSSSEVSSTRDSAPFVHDSPMFISEGVRTEMCLLVVTLFWGCHEPCGASNVRTLVYNLFLTDKD